MDFRDKCLKNDEKLRLIFKVNGNAEEPQEQELTPEAPAEVELMEEDEEEVITLNPNKLYESSDESDDEHPEEVREHSQVQAATPVTSAKLPPPPEPQPVRVGNAINKKEIYHCRYCDIVFCEKLQCINHETNNHNPVNPFECPACIFSTDQYMNLINHCRSTHNSEKPYLCSQCSKSFVRRADLKKHKFVHSSKKLFKELLIFEVN